MADLQAFKATRYNAQYLDDLANLLTPPYDVISPQMQQEFYDKHPKNFVRVDFGREKEGDDATENKYTRSGRRWAEWKESGTLLTDARPAFYAYEQEFDLPGGRGRRTRRGFFAAVKLQEFESGGVKAHEHTFDGPKADRLKLTNATNCNMSPIFCIFNDAERKGDMIIRQEILDQEPITAEMDGVIHRLWVIDHDATVRALIEAMKPYELYIADGHHRYETALNYRAEQRKLHGIGKDEAPYDYTLMFLANTHDPGMEILPTHRVFNKTALEGADLNAVIEKLKQTCDIEDVDAGTTDPTKAAEVLSKKLESAGQKATSFCMLVPGGKALLLSLKATADPTQMVPGTDHAKLKELDVTLLHRYLVGEVWRAGKTEDLDDSNVSYVKDAAEVVKMMQGDEYAAAFLLNATRMEQVIEVAGLGMRMPHKSTYFYPKIITGMVIRDMSEQ